MARTPLYAVLSGHLHHNKIDEVQGVKTIMAGSFLGMDDYCVQKRIYGKAEQMLNDVYALWSNASAQDFGGVTYFPAAGAYDEDELLDLIAHVEAAAGGKAATIIGTKKAIRNLDVTPLGDKAKEDLYNMGYAGKFYGTPVVVAPQRHKVGSTDFVLADDMLTIIAGDDKPIKCVYEGDPIVIMGEPTANGDLTQEYLYGEKYGMGIVLAGGNAGIGRYEIA